MSDQSGRPYYLLALVVGLVLLGWGCVALVSSFGRMFSRRGPDLAVEAAPVRAGAAPGQGAARVGGGPQPGAPNRDTRAAVQLLGELSAAYDEAGKRLASTPAAAGESPTAVLEVLDSAWRAARARADAMLSQETAAGRWTTADVQHVTGALDAYRHAARSLRDFVGSGDAGWMDEAKRQERAALDARDALLR